MQDTILHPALTSDNVNMSYIRPEDRDSIRKEKEVRRRRFTKGYRQVATKNGEREPFCCPKCMRVWEEYTENNKKHRLSYYAGLSTYGLFRMVCPECKEASE